MQDVDSSLGKGTLNKEMVDRFFKVSAEAASVGPNPSFFSQIDPSINVVLNTNPHKTFNLYRNITTPQPRVISNR